MRWLLLARLSTFFDNQLLDWREALVVALFDATQGLA
jgi:hypothetical protein